MKPPDNLALKSPKTFVKLFMNSDQLYVMQITASQTSELLAGKDMFLTPHFSYWGNREVFRVVRDDISGARETRRGWFLLQSRSTLKNTPSKRVNWSWTAIAESVASIQEYDAHEKGFSNRPWRIW